MNEIWANRLIAGTKTWAQCVRSGRSESVKQALAERVKSGDITAEKYTEIVGEELADG